MSHLTHPGTKLGPGRFIMVVGPSGAGKDKLLQLARIACAPYPHVEFPKRIVTRAASLAEDNIAMSEDSFLAAKDSGAFPLYWEAHGLHYGLPKSIITGIEAGRTIVVNVSRTVTGRAREIFAHPATVLITAPPSVLQQRLESRARSSDGPVTARLQRHISFEPPDVTIVNTGPPELHAKELIDVILTARDGRAATSD